MFKKFKTMSQEKNIKVEDGNAQEQVHNENAEQNATQNENNAEANAEEQEAGTDNESAKADNKAENADNKAENAEVDPLTKAQQEVEELKKTLLYKTAEFENYRKRTMKEKADLILNGGEKTISAILPILDDFERALADKSEDPKAIKEGVQMIFNKFVKTLEGLGVKKIETADKDFDVDFHEAIAMVPGMGDDKKGKVIDCVQTGYTLNDKVIRHAKVAVGQ
jgi:molecular chaperone GrpE